MESGAYFFLNSSVLFLIINNTDCRHHQLQKRQRSSILLQPPIEGNCTGSSSGCSIFWACSSSSDYSFSLTALFSQPSHLHPSPQPTPALKHSQYLLRQCDFLQLHRFSDNLQLLEPPSLTPCFALLMSYQNPGAFLQLRQAQSSPHCFPWEKHQQYIFRQKVFLQVQPILRFFPELVAVWTWLILSARESYSGEWARGRSRLSREGGLGMALRVLIIFRLRLHSGKFPKEGRSSKDARRFLSHIAIIILQSTHRKHHNSSPPRTSRSTPSTFRFIFPF